MYIVKYDELHFETRNVACFRKGKYTTVVRSSSNWKIKKEHFQGRIEILRELVKNYMRSGSLETTAVSELVRQISPTETRTSNFFSFLLF